MKSNCEPGLKLKLQISEIPSSSDINSTPSTPLAPKEFNQTSLVQTAMSRGGFSEIEH